MRMNAGGTVKSGMRTCQGRGFLTRVQAGSCQDHGNKASIPGCFQDGTAVMIETFMAKIDSYVYQGRSHDFIRVPGFLPEFTGP